MCGIALVQKSHSMVRQAGGIGMVEIDPVDTERLYQLGLWSADTNTTINHFPKETEIEEAAFILSRYYGRITAYALWWHPTIQKWRIVFGN